MDDSSNAWPGGQNPDDRDAELPGGSRAWEPGYGEEEFEDPARTTDTELRHRRIERARRLVNEPGYPPPEVLNRIARLFAVHMEVEETLPDF
jgi:hypothetical protein